MFFFFKVGGRCGCVYGTKGAVDRKSLETTRLEQWAYVLWTYAISSTYNEEMLSVQWEHSVNNLHDSPTVCAFALPPMVGHIKHTL
jgi:hypothetical protein